MSSPQAPPGDEKTPGSSPAPSSGYLAVLRLPHALRVFLPALIGRLAFATVALSLLLTVEAATGSYGAAGAASGVFGVANVVASPIRARLVDRWGQRRVLAPLAIGHAASLAVLATLASSGSRPLWILIALAGLAGVFAPPLGAAMRVLWAQLTDSPVLRARAYALDAISQETLFTTGPLVVAVVIAVWSPPAALYMTAALSLVGTLFMTSGAASRARVAATVPAKRSSRPLGQPGFVSVVLGLLGVGLALGAVEVAAPAAGEGSASILGPGILLAVFSAASAAGGLVYGHRTWSSPPGRRLLGIGLGMGVSCALLVFVPGLLGLAVGLVVVGFFLAPAFVTGYLLADELTDADVRTEASSWIDTAVNTGAALAVAGCGALIDGSAPGVAFLAGGIGALVCLAVAAPGLARVHRLPARVAA